MERREFISVSLSSLLAGSTQVFNGSELNENIPKQEFELSMRAYIVPGSDKQNRQINLIVQTNDIIPGNVLTIRTENDGERDIYGRYSSYQKGWSFYLPIEPSSTSVQLSLWVNRKNKVDGSPIEIPLISGEIIPPKQLKIRLNKDELLFAHGYENLITEENQFTQKLFSSPNQNHLVRNENEIFDVIVVGSGMGGGLLAKQLCEKKLKVLILEAGSLLYQTNLWNIPGMTRQSGYGDKFAVMDFIPDHRFPDDVTSIDEQLAYFEKFGVHSAYTQPPSICFGGRSNAWAGTILELRRWEREQWPKEIASDLAQYYKEAKQTLNHTISLGPFHEQLLKQATIELGEAYHIEALPRAREQVNLVKNKLHTGEEGYCLKDVIRASSGLYSTTNLLLDFIANSSYSKYLTVHLNHLVEKVSFRGKEVYAVECQDLISKKSRTYKAHKIVLAAGAIASAAIAQRSQLHDKSGKIGIGLTDHPNYEYQFVDNNTFTELDFTTLPIPIGVENHAKILFSHKESSAQGYPCNLQMVVNIDYWDFMSLDDKSWEDKLQRYLHDRTSPMIKFEFYCGSQLNDSNSVIVKDEFKPKFYHQRFCKDERIDNLNKQHIETVLHSIGVDIEKSQLILKRFGGGAGGHAGGSLRVGIDPFKSVVDTNLKFHQYNNLFVCDLSLFPYIGASNPSLTLSALAIRLADHLAK